MSNLLIDGLTRVGSSKVDPVAARRAVLRVHGVLAANGHDVPIRLWDGTRAGPADAVFRIALRHPWSLRAILLPGTDLAVGEAYLDDVFDVEGSMVEAIGAVAALRADRLRLLDVATLVAAVLRMPRPPHAASDERARLRGEAHSLARDRNAVRHHYDVGNDFYALFLDRAMVYSCAYFDDDDAEAALDRAQERKLEVVCRKLGVGRETRLLDIGCGWGALVIHAARRHGATALGITLSDQQAEEARRRAIAAGVGDLVEIRVQDYREVDGTFDAVASVGMVEHVGAARLDDYFGVVHRLVAHGGRLLNHGITTGKREEIRDFSVDTDTFVGRYVFPDGALVPSGWMVAHAERAGFEVVDLEQLRPHYAMTLRHWVRRLEARRDEAVAVAGLRQYRTWRAYMAASAVGFASMDLGVIQLLCSKGAAMPLSRPRYAPHR